MELRSDWALLYLRYFEQAHCASCSVGIPGVAWDSCWSFGYAKIVGKKKAGPFGEYLGRPSLCHGLSNLPCNHILSRMPAILEGEVDIVVVGPAGALKSAACQRHGRNLQRGGTLQLPGILATKMVNNYSPLAILSPSDFNGADSCFYNVGEGCSQ